MTAGDQPNASRRSLPHESDHERELRHRLGQLLARTPIPAEELVDNLALYLRRQPLTDLLSLDALYRMVLDLPGVIMELGVHRGRHLAALTALRGVHEPYNPHRRILGFDTFTGLPEPALVDTTSPSAVAGRLAVADDYPDHLRAVLDSHEQGEHLGHIQRTLIIQGDVRETLPAYLADNPHTLVALVYFDLDLYEPTRAALDAIQPYLTQGSVLAFDQPRSRQVARRNSRAPRRARSGPPRSAAGSRPAGANSSPGPNSPSSPAATSRRRPDDRHRLHRDARRRRATRGAVRGADHPSERPARPDRDGDRRAGPFPGALGPEARGAGRAGGPAAASVDPCPHCVGACRPLPAGRPHRDLAARHAWYRHITLSMLAHVWLATIARSMTEKNPLRNPPVKTAVGYERVSGGLSIKEPDKPERMTMVPLRIRN